MREEGIIQKYLEYIVAFCIVINCNTIWDRIGLGKINSILLFGTLIILSYIALKDIMKNGRVFLKVIVILIFIIISEIIFIYFNGENLTLFFRIFILIFIPFIVYSIYLLKNNKLSNILIKISNVIIVLAIISLIFYILASVLNIISPNAQITLEWGYTRTVPSYYHLYYNTQWLYLGGVKLFRNTGIFTEAPMYSFCLCIALSIQLFIKQNTDKKNIAVLLVAVLSTLSTTGIVVGFGSFVLYLLYKRTNNFIYAGIKIIIFPLIVMIFVSISAYFIMDKINGSNNKYGSFSARIDDFRVGIEAWKKHKIVGHGFDRHDITQTYMSRNIREGDMGGASGLMMVLPQGGICLLMIYVIPLVLSLYFSMKRQKMGVAILAVTATGLFIVTNIPYTYMMVYLLAIGLACVFEKDFRRKELE